MKTKIRAAIVICAAIAAVAAVFVGVLTITGGTFDVIGKQAVDSFEQLLSSGKIEAAADAANNGWSVTSPDGSVRFIFSEDYSNSPLFDVMLELDAKPFLNAGLEPSKLSENYIYREGKLIVGVKYGDDSFSYDGSSTPLAAFENLEKHYRSRIGYHASMGHYNVDLGDENQFEWAQDMAENDKDIVFALNPEPLIEAGVDPEQVEDWSYAQVPVGHSGTSETVLRFLKTFDLM